jgi:acyl transferase domain-containing protein/thioesterase domain-containing protein/acyl carrier protein
MNTGTTDTGLEIAVIGMAGRFPGAAGIREFWENLKNGVESITFFSDSELEEAGVDPQLLQNTNYVRANSLLECIDRFDASFFGYTPMEASVMDPQSRIFHECVWEALEDAGYNPDTYKGLIGLYAGATPNFNWEALAALSEKSMELGEFVVESLAQKDFLSTGISYKLNLRGPSFSLQTACSTSLVAIHVACQAVLNGECSMALAGGITAVRTRKSGYWYQEGMIHSPDGHCRAFDINGQGIIGGDGAGVVVLKRLQDAAADGDHIYGVVKSSAINNDGIRKVGFTAPSVQGQAEAIRIAQLMAEVEPETISYIETHGTGTPLGDPVEIEALKLAFNTDKKNFCAIGSVKTNVGHLDSAAGVTGFIKAVLALKHKLIPPTLHFQRPNPKLGIEESPFYVNTTLKEWKNNHHPLRAGVSSFGIGGTNAHVILEEVPESILSQPSSPSREYQVIMLSAKTRSALDRVSDNLARYLQENPGIPLADTAYTLQVGRKTFNHRKVLVCSRIEEAVEALSTSGSENVFSAVCREQDQTIAFIFPGQGAQYVNMGIDLYKTEPVFQEAMDRCFDILKPLMGYDLKEILYPSFMSNKSNGSYMSNISQTEITQPVIFIFEYALAQLLISWGITPFAMIGHSIGEYTAACLAEVFSIEDALSLVVLRGKLMQSLPKGSMLSVPLSEEVLTPLLTQLENLSLAAVNSPSRCVVSGKDEDIDAFAEKLKTEGNEGTRLHTSHAFHSPMMDPILEKFQEKVKHISLSKPKIPYISNVTGTWISNHEAADPAYWVRHLRYTVRFSEGVHQLLEKEIGIMLEVGPGKTLSTFVQQHPTKTPGPRVLNLVRPPREELSDNRYLLTKIGQLWMYGGKIDWSGFYSGEKRNRIPLPTYPFEPQRHPTDGNPYKIVREMVAGSTLLWQQRMPDMANWFYESSWEPSPLPDSDREKTSEPLNWLVFIDKTGVGRRLAEKLEQEGQKVVIVKAGITFTCKKEGAYIIDPRKDEDYNTLFGELKKSGYVPHRVVHCWTIDPFGGVPGFENVDQLLDTGLYSLLGIAKAIGLQRINHPLHIQVISGYIQSVSGEEQVEPHKATLLGPVKIIPLEYKNVTCSSIDIFPPEAGSPEEEALVNDLLAELRVSPGDQVVAYREGLRHVQRIIPIRLDRSNETVQRFKEKGVYLVIGGFGGMGFSIAEHLAKNFKARLILVGRTALPPREEWSQRLGACKAGDDVCRKIRIIQEMEATGAEVMIFSADVADYLQMKDVFQQAAEQFGHFDGVLHTAGVADFGGVIQTRSRETTRKYMASKVIGTLVLEQLLKEYRMKPDVLVLFSSVGNILYKTKFGEVSYNAANEFMDAYVHYRTGKDETYGVTINWCDWSEVGMTVNVIKQDFAGREEKIDYDSMIRHSVNPKEGIEVFNRIMEHSRRRVLVYSYNLEHEIREQKRAINKEKESSGAVKELHTPVTVTLNQRPELSTQYAPPTSHTEQVLVKIWENFFGIEKIGINDDFFELGGDSLKALAIVPYVNKELSFNITLTDILLFTTIRALAANVHQENTSSKLECIVKLNKGQNKKNIFIVHPMHGMVYQYKELAKELEDAYNVFGIQARSLTRNSEFPATMQIMVNDYIHQIQETQREGPYVIGGYCFGDPVGYLIIKQLEDMGFSVKKFIMFDEPSFIPEYVLWFFRQKTRFKKIFTPLKSIIPFFKNNADENPARARYQKFVEEIQKSKAKPETECEVPPEEIEKRKAAVEKKIEEMYKIYIKQWPYKRLTGIISAPILDIKAKDSHFTVIEKPLRKMTYGSLTLEETCGDHTTMLEQPHVKKVAEIIKNHVG